MILVAWASDERTQRWYVSSMLRRVSRIPNNCACRSVTYSWTLDGTTSLPPPSHISQPSPSQFGHGAVKSSQLGTQTLHVFPKNTITRQQRDIPLAEHPERVRRIRPAGVQLSHVPPRQHLQAHV